MNDLVQSTEVEDTEHDDDNHDYAIPEALDTDPKGTADAWWQGMILKNPYT